MPPPPPIFFYGNKMENSKWTRQTYLASSHSPRLATQKTEFASSQPCNDNECYSFTLPPCQDHGCLLLAQCVHANERRLKDILFLMYKVKHQMVPGYFENIVKRNDLKPYSLRNSDFILPRYNTVKYGRHSIRYLGPLLWSKLASSERNTPTLKDFKQMIDCRDISALDNSSCASCYLCNT